MKLFSYWSGRPTWLERLSVASAIATDHELTVYTYGDRGALSSALGCRVEDAGKITRADPALAELRATMPAHFSDHFRLEALAQGLGTWTDLDVIFLKHLPDDPYLFGWQGRGRLGNSLLRIPAGSELLRQYLSFCRKRPMVRYVMPWHSTRQKIARTLKAATAKIAPFTGVPDPEPKYGPDALTHFASATNVISLAKPERVIYPLPCQDSIIRRADEPGVIDSMIAADTLCVHMWRSTYWRPLPKSGWVAKQWGRLELDAFA
ncbi:hypothetical protein [Hyphomicrobium sp.]|uniref:hypothetical protein n=1 Tax=Hyphomicrobium sp. TaxID=82 RepID=UPI002D7666D9|nr:hypothetical protein [Hyphomicrobium sp.]HET6390942.1 hypothetical protein [Hyphomicrobium sp.]